MNTQTVKTLITGVLAGILGAYLFVSFSQSSTKTFPNSESQTQDNNQTPQGTFASYQRNAITPDFVKAAETATECVVYIKTVSGTSQSYTWLDFFFNGDPRSHRSIGSGSGVIFSKDGYIVTNNHVVEDADEIEVIHNKRTYKAEIIGTDPSTDLALLKVKRDDLPFIRIATSKEVRVGDWVLAVGNPFNLESTVTAGIVSAKGRNIHILEDQFPIESFIQTDAAINPGNSGGALVNIKGELVGINTAIISRTGSYAGYGFAVPSDIVVKVITDLKEYGQVQKAFIGAEVVDIDEEIYEALELKEYAGVVISRIEEDGSANKVGLERGDIILKINGENIGSKSNFDEQLSYRRPGDKITIEYKRDGKLKTIDLQLTNIQGTTDIVKREIVKAPSIGAELELVPKAERKKLGIENGIRIIKVSRGLIARLGLEEGFIVTSVNNIEVTTPEELITVLEQIQGQVIIRGISKKGVRKYYNFYF